MIVNFTLVGDELEEWRDEAGRKRLVDRCREIASGADINQIRIHFGNRGDVLELAPEGHDKLAHRLRDLDAHLLADLVDPSKQRDVVERQRYADQLQRVAAQFAVKPPIGDEL